MTGTRNIILCILWCLICTNERTAAKRSTFDEVIDLKCNNNLDCTIHGSVCTDNTCQCPLGFIFNELMTSCIEVARYGEKCVESSQCSRYLSSGGSCVNNVCLCSDGFYYFHGRCNAYTGLLEKCNKDDQCYVHAEFNAASCKNGTCKCSDGFYQREYRTCRREGKKVGDACTINNDCRFSNAVCNNFRCAVSQVRNNKLESSFDTSYLQQNDVVRIEAGTNKTCTVDADCKNIANSICGPSKMCTCKRAYFFMDEIQQCVPELGEACSATDKASIDNSECQNGMWTCEAGRVISMNNQQCKKATRKYGDSCQTDIQCSILGPDALCKNYQCICNEDSQFIESVLFCWKKRGINEMCQHDRDCHVSGINSTLSCKNSVCSCPDGTHANSDRTNCIADAADLGATCEEAKDCVTGNAACKNGVCVCEDNYYQSERQCLPGVNATCARNEDCKPEKSQCLSERCRCEEGYVAASAGLCVQIVTFGEACEKDVQCSATVTGAVCSVSNNSTTNRTCACIEGYHNRFNKCFKRKVLGMACDTLGECYLSSNWNRVVCRNGECACDWGYEPQNGTMCETSSKTRAHINDATTKSLTGLLSVLLLLANILLFD